MAPDEPVTEEAIDAAEKLRSKGEFAASLELTQKMLVCAEDDGTRMRLLFNVVSCAASLDRAEIIEAAIDELERLPKPEVSRVLVSLNRAWAETSLGRPVYALSLLDMSLATGLFEAEDMRIHKYILCLFKGEALLHLHRTVEALEWLDRGHELYPTIETASSTEERQIFAWVEPNIQINRANCMLAFDRYEESFQAAEQVLKFDKADLATFAMQYMAECRLWQRRVPEALEIYAKLKKRLPCRLVDESRIQQGIDNCMTYLGKQRPPSRPS
jgi:tetratricopeptide (TPR) repeat protein